MTSIYDIDTVTLADEGDWMNLEHPTTGEELLRNGKPIRLNMLGGDGERAQKLQQKAAEKIEHQRQRNRGKRDLNFETLVYKDMMARIVVGTDNLADDDGEVEYSPEAMKRIFDRAPWLFEQAFAFFNNRSNFLKPSAPN